MKQYTLFELSTMADCNGKQGEEGRFYVRSIVTGEEYVVDGFWDEEGSFSLIRPRLGDTIRAYGNATWFTFSEKQLKKDFNKLTD